MKPALFMSLHLLHCTNGIIVLIYQDNRLHHNLFNRYFKKE